MSSEQTKRLEMADHEEFNTLRVKTELMAISHRLDATEARLGEAGNIGQRLAVVEANMNAAMGEGREVEANQPKYPLDAVERVAKAIAESWLGLPGGWDGYGTESREAWRAAAKAAIGVGALTAESPYDEPPPPADGAEEMASRVLSDHNAFCLRNNYTALKLADEARLKPTLIAALTSHAAAKTKALREELEEARKFGEHMDKACAKVNAELEEMKARAEKAEGEAAELNLRLAQSSQLETTALEEVVGLRVLLTARERRVEELEKAKLELWLALRNTIAGLRMVRDGVPFRAPAAGEVGLIDECQAILDKHAAGTPTPPPSPAPTGEIESQGATDYGAAQYWTSQHVRPCWGDGATDLRSHRNPAPDHAVDTAVVFVGGHPGLGRDLIRARVCEAFLAGTAHARARAGTASRWRDAEREKPANDEIVLIWPRERFGTARWCHGVWWPPTMAGGRPTPTHWMPLPDPPATGRSAG